MECLVAAHIRRSAVTRGNMVLLWMAVLALTHGKQWAIHTTNPRLAIICNRSNAMVMAGAGLLPSTNLQIRHTVSQKGQLMCFCG